MHGFLKGIMLIGMLGFLAATVVFIANLTMPLTSADMLLIWFVIGITWNGLSSYGKENTKESGVSELHKQ